MVERHWTLQAKPIQHLDFWQVDTVGRWLAEQGPDRSLKEALYGIV